MGWRIDSIRTFGQLEFDFGDAPDPSYPTFLANRGAAHVVAGPKLGAAVDIDVDGQPNATAMGDDANGVGDDEDGLVLPASLPRGRTTAIIAIASSPALFTG